MHPACGVDRPPSSPPAQSVLGGDAGVRPKNIIWAVAHGRDARSRSTSSARRGRAHAARAAVNLVSQKMGIHEWSYDNDISGDLRHKVPLKIRRLRLKSIKVEVELGFDAKMAFAEAQRLPELRRADGVLGRRWCIECDACVDICPMDCITFTATARKRNCVAGSMRPRGTVAGFVHIRHSQDRPHHGPGRRCLPALRVVRRALPTGPGT